MALADVMLAPGVDRREALHLVGSLEHASEHPVARAIAAAAAADGASPQPESFKNREGLGVEGVVDGHARDRRSSLTARGVGPQLPQALVDARQLAEAEGKTAVAAGWDGSVRALVRRLRPGEADEPRGDRAARRRSAFVPSC